MGLVFLLRDPSHMLSALELQAVLGHLAWFALLTRPVFSTLHDVYAEARRDDTSKAPLRGESLAELTLFVMLLPLIDADLTRPWADIIVASDASPSYGFGVSVAPASVEVCRAFSRTAARKGAFARLDRDGHYPDEEPEKPRKGQVCPLPICKAAFATVVSSPAVHAAHAGALEAGGVRLALRWFLRSEKRHGRRLVMLVDAQAVLGAVAKGRSSSPSLRESQRCSSPAMFFSSSCTYPPRTIRRTRCLEGSYDVGGSAEGSLPRPSDRSPRLTPSARRTTRRTRLCVTLVASCAVSGPSLMR